MDFSSRPVYSYFWLTQAWLSWLTTAPVVCITWALQLLSEMGHTQLRVLWKKTENIVKLKTEREVMSGRVNISFDEISWDKINLSLPSQHWKVQDGVGNSQAGEETLVAKFTFLSLCNKLNSATSPPCSRRGNKLHLLFVISINCWVSLGGQGGSFRETSSACIPQGCAGTRSLL